MKYICTNMVTKRVGWVANHYTCQVYFLSLETVTTCVLLMYKIICSIYIINDKLDKGSYNRIYSNVGIKEFL